MTGENLEKLQLSVDTVPGVGGNEVLGASSSPPDIAKFHRDRKKKADRGTGEADEIQ